MTLLIFAALAGAVQMVTPDRWMPASIFVWQRGWGSFRTAAFTIILSAIHLVLGFGVFALLSHFLAAVPEDFLGLFTFLFLGSIGIIRMLRFGRIREMVIRNRGSFRAMISLLFLMGPSEIVIPVLMRARMDGEDPHLILLMLLGGASIAGIAAVAISRAQWNKPLMLPSIFQWCQSRRALLPVSVGALVGIVLISLHSL